MRGCNKDCEEYEAVISALPDLVFVLTESGQYADIIGGQDAEFYHDASGLIGASLFDVMPDEKANWFLERIQQTLGANRLMVFEYSLAGNDVDKVDNGSGPSGTLWFEGRVKPLPSVRYGERAVVWVARNITKRHMLEEELQFYSEIDALSGTLNRRKLFHHLEDALYSFRRYHEQSGFLMLDVDDFKKINDTYGHQCGDSAIRNIASVCQSELRHTDVIGRLGGDEFGIIYRDKPHDYLLALAERLNERVKRCAHECTFPCNVSISIGISCFRTDDEGIEQIYQRADQALYEVKRKGKDGFVLKI